ncbi:MAG: hypothetical protein NDJ90_04060 [Oligoflexia bacterium]|nr:hypothetical protein [Oligoflexia bacterium]
MGDGTSTSARGTPDCKYHLNKIGRGLAALWRDDGGQATLEYILILTFTVGAAAALARGLLGALNKGVLTLGAQLERNLKTGRAPAHVFVN